MSGNILILATTVAYTIMISTVVAMNKRLDEIENMLRKYFYKIDYHSLELLLKNSKGSHECPPNSSEDNI